ncbi:hypothetical protein Taro_034864 [Colocasia esculenta]|uniref:CCHC-type domain-containing protein n=1 Tax=Colocasia esculenta TaxID=4460 RepID=A0A843VSN8_COLES|nr:hypothetical protein [Colocasia esculenta]
MATQGHFEGQFVNRPPLFVGEYYNYWKTRMKFFLLGLDFQIWSIIEEGDLVVLNNKENWTEDDKKKISLNCKAKSILCCALSKKKFNRISACKSVMEMWEKLRITYEGTDKVKETRIDILVAQYERFQMQQGESITQMYSRFKDITNGLAGLGKNYDMGDMVRKILRSLPASWTPKVTAIEEANDLWRLSLEKLIGSLMAHEINMERLGESSSRKKHSSALMVAEDTSGEESDGDKSIGSSEDEEAFLSRRLPHILAKKKYQSGRRYFKKGKEFKKSEAKDVKRSEPTCYECKKPGHIKAECPKLKKVEFKKKDNTKKFKRFKKKAMAAAWDNDTDSDSESSLSEEEENANLAFMANIEDKNPPLFNSMAVSGVSGTVGGYGAVFLIVEQQERFATMKTTLCSNKAVDVADLEKNGMHSVVAAIQRMKWSKMVTISKSLFGVSTAGHSGVNTVDICTKGLRIVGLEYKLKDVPRSATFSSCLKADSDMMLWAIQNQEINMAEVIIDRMKLASAVIWDMKNKLKQEEVRAEISVVQEEQAAVAAAEISVEVQEANGSRIEDIPLEFIELFGQVEEVVTPASMVASVLRGVLDSITSTQGEPEMGGDQVAEVVASGHNEDILMEDAPSQREHVAEKEAEF